MINGIHALVYSKNAERAPLFFKDILGLSSVDAGDGWLMFALPPAELALHPTDEETQHELYFMCDNVYTTTEQLKKKGVEILQPIADRGWGLVSRIRIPGGDEFGLYEPKHPTAINLKPRRTPRTRTKKRA